MATLTEDIKAIRKFKKISLNDLYDKTKVPTHIIDMIDNGTIFAENPNNKTYVRSFVRTYAKGLGISETDIIQALDDQELDVYEGFLADKYLSNDPIDPKGPVQKTDSHGTDKKAASGRRGIAQGEPKEEKQEESKEVQKPKKKTPPASKKASASPKAKESDRDLDEEDEKIRRAKSTHTSGSQSVDMSPDVTKPYNSRTPQHADLNSIDWSSTVKRFNPLESKSKAYIILGSAICVIMLGALIVYGFRADTFSNWGFSNGGSTANLDEAVQLPITADTAAVQNGAEQSVPASLPDTLELVVLAANDKLEPVRIRSDINNVLTPFWIEQGDTHHAAFIDEILIRGQYSRMSLIYNGHEIENITDLTTQDQFVRITREFLDADPKYKTTGDLDYSDDENLQSDPTEEVAD